MKKLAIVAAVFALLTGVRLYAGENVDSPVGKVANPITADYGGVDLWIATFSAQVSTVGLPALSLQSPPGQYATIGSTTVPSRKEWRIYGAYFSTGNCGSNDNIEVFQSTGGFIARSVPGASAITAIGNPLAAPTGSGLRFYNNQGSTATAAGNNIGSCSGFTTLRWPIRLTGNVFFQGSSAGYNSQGILYWKEPD